MKRIAWFVLLAVALVGCREIPAPSRFHAAGGVEDAGDDTTVGKPEDAANNPGADVAEVLDSSDATAPDNTGATDVAQTEVTDGTDASDVVDATGPQDTVVVADAGSDAADAVSTGDVKGDGDVAAQPDVQQDVLVDKCAGKNCDDANVCTVDSCDAAGVCQHVNNTFACDDGNACTTGDACSGGACTGSVVSCQDNNVCTDDSCDKSSGCVHANNVAPCNDGSACTASDTCSLGVCVPGTAVNCADGNPCTADSCVAQTGCVSLPVAATCDDGNSCTNDDSCVNAVCKGTGGPNCDDGNPCTTDGCNASTGCTHATVVDGTACSAGSCPVTGWQAPATCLAGACSAPPPAIGCDDQNVCTDDLCNALQGCVHSPNTAACDDGNACTANDSCASAICAGKMGSCDDANACTVDACDKSAGCNHTATGGTCSDGDPCTVGDTCAGTICAAGTGTLTCDDGQVCTDDGCTPGTGCSHTATADGKSCSDGNACTQSDTCAGGTCKGANPLTCAPVDSCHGTGTCNAATGVCSSATLANGTVCDDGNIGTSGDKCASGICIGTPIPCDAGTYSADGTKKNGACTPCNEGTYANGTGKTTCTPCGAGTYASGTGNKSCTACAAGAAATGTGNANCTTCTPGTYASGTGNTLCTACGAGKFSAATGATSSTTCTSCSAGTYAAGTGNSTCTACGIGTSSSATGATSAATCVACAAGSYTDATGKATCTACLAGSVASGTGNTECTTCGAGTYAAGTGNKSCIACGAGTASSSTGATSSATCTPCDAGTFASGTGNASCIACAEGMYVSGSGSASCTTCPAGTFAAGTGNPSCAACSCTPGTCQAFTCAAATGTCSYGTKTDGSTCDDGDGCTVSDTCTVGACAGSPKVCAMLDQCHVAGSCSGGVCSNPNTTDGSSCNDGSACTSNDICTGGACQGAMNCDDANSCTIDSCPSAAGCLHVNAPDGIACGSIGFCNAGVCFDWPVAVAITVGNSHTCAIDKFGTATCWGENGLGQLGDGTSIDRSAPHAVAVLGTGVLGISAGDDFTCAIGATGAVSCWGFNYHGSLGTGDSIDSFAQETPGATVTLGSVATQVATGSHHACALISGGGVKCWGDNYYGQLGNGTQASTGTPVSVSLGGTASVIAAGGESTCAVVAGTVKCWGRILTNSPSGPPQTVNVSNKPISAIDLGSNHACAIGSGGATQCWGYNATGQLGNGSTDTGMSGPASVTGLGTGVVSITAGGGFSCALKTGGVGTCWGQNYYGGLDNGTTIDSSVPVPCVGLGTGLKAIAAGTYHACAILAQGGIECWGNNDSGQLGDGMGGVAGKKQSVAGIGTVNSIGSGRYNTCASLQSGGIKCWGSNGSGQLGAGSAASQSYVAVSVSGISLPATAIAGGWEHMCALLTDGGVDCWGYNNKGQIGNGSTATATTPVMVGSGSASVAAGYDHTCAISLGGSVSCWGNNSTKQLGNGNTTNKTTPTGTMTLPSAATEIVAGDSYTCALLVDGSVGCWGTLYGSSPINPGSLVAGLNTGIWQIASGDTHVCALAQSGVQCWGNGSWGKLGNGLQADSSAPVAVTNIPGNATAIGAGQSHTCVALSGGGVACWGSNQYGQLGDGTQSDQSSPTLVVGLTATVVAISGGASHTCVLQADGHVVCWGLGDDGELGRETWSTIGVGVLGFGP